MSYVFLIEQLLNGLQLGVMLFLIAERMADRLKGA